MIVFEMNVRLSELGDEYVIGPGGGTDKDARRIANLIADEILRFVGLKRRRDYPDMHSFSLVSKYKLYGLLEIYLYRRAKKLKLRCLPIPQEERPTTNKYDSLKLHSLELELEEEDPKIIIEILTIVTGGIV